MMCMHVTQDSLRSTWRLRCKKTSYASTYGMHTNLHLQDDCRCQTCSHQCPFQGDVYVHCAHAAVQLASRIDEKSIGRG
jgi:hypothetical protein